MGLAELESAYGRQWVIRDDLAIGVAAWRRTDLPPSRLGPFGVNVLIARDLDELDAKLARQEAPPEVPAEPESRPPFPRLSLLRPTPHSIADEGRGSKRPVL